MIIITMDKRIETYDIERLGKVYAEQVKAGAIVLPNGAKAEELAVPCGMVGTVIIIDEDHEQDEDEDDTDEEDNEPNIKRDEWVKDQII